MEIPKSTTGSDKPEDPPPPYSSVVDINRLNYASTPLISTHTRHSREAWAQDQDLFGRPDPVQYSRITDDPPPGTSDHVAPIESDRPAQPVPKNQKNACRVFAGAFFTFAGMIAAMIRILRYHSEQK